MKSNAKKKFNTVVDDGTKKTSELLADLKSLFPVRSYYRDADLDRDFSPVKTSRTFRNTQEPDEDTADKSANDLANDGKEYMTLRERLIFELLYFKAAGKHPDEKYITLCAGARDRNGHVPFVLWDSFCGELRVDADGPQDANDRLRSRAVSFPNPSSSSSRTLPSDLEQRVKDLEAWRDGLIKVWEEQLKKMLP